MDSETWFRTTFSGRIEPVEVIKETEKMLNIVNPYRRGGAARVKKSSEYYRTWGEAHAALLERYTLRVESLRRQLEQANGHLGNIKGMRAPTPAEGGE